MSGRWCAACGRYTLFGCCRIHCPHRHLFGMTDQQVRDVWRRAEEEGR